MALYHAEIIGKVGAMIGGLTYGAKAAEADKHIKAALKLTPDSPIAHIEHGNVLMLLHGEQAGGRGRRRLRKGRQGQAAGRDGGPGRGLCPGAAGVTGAGAAPRPLDRARAAT